MNSEGVWIPITLVIVNTNQNNGINVIGEAIEDINGDGVADVVIRLYKVESKLVDSTVDYSVQLCGFAMVVNSVQFRWLQTSTIVPQGSTPLVRDTWALDNIRISYHEDNSSVVLLQDSFDEFELK